MLLMNKDLHKFGGGSIYGDIETDYATGEFEKPGRE